jgi:hypothetical protein
MPRAVDLLRQGRDEELWQMCCGFLRLNINEFMDIQERLLLQQLELLNNCALGEKIMHGAKPRTVEEFRRQVPLTSYKDYCPELMEKREDTLPAKPAQWVRSSGRSGEYPCRWIPLTPDIEKELGVMMYGIGNLSCCKGWKDVSRLPVYPKIITTTAPRPYLTGAMASMLTQQTPVDYLPPLEEAEKLPFEERLQLGFKQSLYKGIDYFYGLSLVLVKVGEKFTQSTGKLNILPLLKNPKALIRLMSSLIRARMAGRQLMPKDLWPVKGIICTGLDSWAYRKKIKEFWGRYPLDVYAATEGGIIATQQWDYDTMTFVPNLNFLEFIPEEECLKLQMDSSYHPQTVCLDGVEAGKIYEIVITNLHGGSLVRYRIGDLIRIVALKNEKLGIEIPQMLFERRADGLINFVVVQLTERIIWQAIENTGILYEDWTAYKIPGESVLRVLIEPKNGFKANDKDLSAAIRKQILKSDKSNNEMSGVLDDLTDMFDFNVEVKLLPAGAFANYAAQKTKEGADLAHLKPPHLNPSGKVLAALGVEEEVTIVVEKSKKPAEVPGSEEGHKTPV